MDVEVAVVSFLGWQGRGGGKERERERERVERES